jgi:hypothetical protein
MDVIKLIVFIAERRVDLVEILLVDDHRHSIAENVWAGQRIAGT